MIVGSYVYELLGDPWDANQGSAAVNHVAATVETHRGGRRLVIPYAQKIVSDYLREHDDVGGRVVSTPPDGDKRGTSWVMVTQLAAPQDPTSRHDHLVEFYFQIDCYAGATGGLPEALTLGGDVRAAIVAMPDRRHDDAVVTATQITVRPLDPDTDDGARRANRVVLTASVLDASGGGGLMAFRAFNPDPKGIRELVDECDYSEIADAVAEEATQHRAGRDGSPTATRSTPRATTWSPATARSSMPGCSSSARRHARLRDP